MECRTLPRPIAFALVRLDVGLVTGIELSFRIGFSKVFRGPDVVLGNYRPLVSNKLSHSRAWFWPWRYLVTEEVNDPLVCKVGSPDKWPLAQLLPTGQCAFPVPIQPRLAGSWWIVANVANVPTRQLLLRQHIPCPGSQLIHLNQFEPILMHNGRNRVKVRIYLTHHAPLAMLIEL